MKARQHFEYRFLLWVCTPQKFGCKPGIFQSENLACPARDDHWAYGFQERSAGPGAGAAFDDDEGLCVAGCIAPDGRLVHLGSDDLGPARPRSFAQHAFKRRSIRTLSRSWWSGGGGGTKEEIPRIVVRGGGGGCSGLFGCPARARKPASVPSPCPRRRPRRRCCGSSSCC